MRMGTEMGMRLRNGDGDAAKNVKNFWRNQTGSLDVQTFPLHERLQNYVYDLLMQYSSGKSTLVFWSTRKGAQEATQVRAQTAMNHGYSNPFIKSSDQHERLSFTFMWGQTGAILHPLWGQCTNEITIRKRYASAVTTGSGTSSIKNTCNNRNWRRMLVNKLEKENGNKELVLKKFTDSRPSS
ncbi:hypothetical protein Tco_0013759 [Tanacetum coccineum]